MFTYGLFSISPTAILTAGCPSSAAFMADEPTALLLASTSLKYTLQEYLEYMDKVWSLVDRLNTEGICK